MCYLAKKEVVDLRCQVQSQKMQKKRLNGNLFVRDVLGLKDYGVAGNTSMSKSIEDAAIKFARDTHSALNNVDEGEDIELENLN